MLTVSNLYLTHFEILKLLYYCKCFPQKSQRETEPWGLWYTQRTDEIVQVFKTSSLHMLLRQLAILPWSGGLRPEVSLHLLLKGYPTLGVWSRQSGPAADVIAGLLGTSLSLPGFSFSASLSFFRPMNITRVAFLRTQHVVPAVGLGWLWLRKRRMTKNTCTPTALHEEPCWSAPSHVHHVSLLPDPLGGASCPPALLPLHTLLWGATEEVLGAEAVRL